MKIAVASVQVPFIKGGAEYLNEGLVDSLRQHGHSVDLVTLPFRFNSRFISNSIDDWRRINFDEFDAGQIDTVICLKFPSYNIFHQKKIVWLLHQHRSIYDLFNTNYGESDRSKTANDLREIIMKADVEAFESAKALYTISKVVSDRLKKYNGISSKVIYHPPPFEKTYESGAIFPYIFSPSRLEKLKRQDLLIKALPYVNKKIKIIIAGIGGEMENFKKITHELNLSDRVIFVGHVSQEQKARYYSNSLAVFFGPYQEDLGYITLEAMLSSKPVITCTDSGGPLEFISNENTGFIVEPEPMVIADKINMLWSNLKKAKEIGNNAIKYYEMLNISWNNAVDELLKEVS